MSVGRPWRKGRITLHSRMDTPSRKSNGRPCPAARPYRLGRVLGDGQPSGPCVRDTYREFIRRIAEQIAIGLASARAYEQERRRAEALTEIDRAKTAFFRNVSHELG